MSTKLGGTVDGIKIHVYAGDHNPPHVHIRHGENEVRYTLDEDSPAYMDDTTGFNKSKLKLAVEYAAKHRERLLENFERANPNLRGKK